jgi:hypothetical protein
MEQNQTINLAKNQAQAIAPNSLETLMKGHYTGEVAYHELDEIPVRKIDQLELLHKNLAQLSNLHARLRFMNQEIRYLMKI